MDPKMRANAFAAFGALSKYALGGQREGFVEQIHSTLPRLVVHLHDDDASKRQACRVTLKRFAPLMDIQNHSTMYDSRAFGSDDRQGSGSACRSLFGEFVKWEMGIKEDGSYSVAVQLADEKHCDDLVIIMAVVSSREKETSSTSGMRENVETSLLLQHRAKEVVPVRVLQVEEAIKNPDFTSFTKLACADSNQFHAVCMDTSPPIFYMNDTSHRIISLVEKWNRSVRTPEIAYTFEK